MPSPEQSPFGWANWDERQARFGSTFICWAEPPPQANTEFRYAILRSGDHPGAFTVWARVSPNPQIHPEFSGGGFYTIPEEGKEAVSWAIEAAMKHKSKIRELVGD